MSLALSRDQISGRGTCEALRSGCLPWPSPMPTPPRAGQQPSGIDSSQFCPGSPLPEEDLELREEVSLSWSPTRPSFSRSWGSLAPPALSLPAQGWVPGEGPCCSLPPLPGPCSLLWMVHISGQGRALYASFQHSGWGPWPAGLASHPGSPSLTPQACGSVGGQPAPTCTLHALSLSPHHSQGGCHCPLQIKKLLRVTQGLVPRPV